MKIIKKHTKAVTVLSSLEPQSISPYPVGSFEWKSENIKLYHVGGRESRTYKTFKYADLDLTGFVNELLEVMTFAEKKSLDPQTSQYIWLSKWNFETMDKFSKYLRNTIAKDIEVLRGGLRYSIIFSYVESEEVQKILCVMGDNKLHFRPMEIDQDLVLFMENLYEQCKLYRNFFESHIGSSPTAKYRRF